MTAYELTIVASADLLTIFRRILDKKGYESAVEVEAKLTTAFERLARMPGLGHRRPDLTEREVFFYRVEPYMVLYERGHDPLIIVGLLHESQDMRRALRRR